MINIFENPSKYIEKLRQIKLVNIDSKTEFSGKSIAVIFPIKYCNANCKFCIFRSPVKKNNENSIKDELNEIGIEKSIEFINKSEIGYLLVSGGGEPFFKFDNLLKLIKEVNVNDIVVVTNGFWAKDYSRAVEYLEKMKKIQLHDKKNITIRVSIDRWHCENLGNKHIKNLIDIFAKKFNNDKEIKLKIHTISGDDTLYEILNKYKYNYDIEYKDEYSSDNYVLNKSNRRRATIKFCNEYKLEVEFAKLFKPNLEVDLKEEIISQYDVFMEDLLESQKGNFSTVINTDGTKGLDFLINYNGNVSTWANYQISNSPNLYKHNYDELMDKIYNDIISYSFLKEPFRNIIEIVNIVNPVAVKRAIGINIRDYFGMYLLYENKTLLYYYVMILKNYIKDNIVINIEQIPSELRKIIKLNKEDIIKLYKESNYSIVDQYMEREFLKEEWEDLFFLISRNHFEVSKDQIEKAIRYYNENTKEKFTKYEQIINNEDVNRYRRLLERFNA